MLLPEEGTGSGEFAFGAAAMGADGCFELTPRAVLLVAPCVGVWAGEMHAVVFPKTLLALPPGGRFWSSADVTARVRVRIVAPLFAEAEVGVFIPFVRYGFSVVGEQGPVFQEHAVLPTGSIALGVSFP
jgi:hypothetical protein